MLTKGWFQKNILMQLLMLIHMQSLQLIIQKGQKNYIGANTFAEIAVAFYFGKKIFLLNDIYEPFIDELTAWEAYPLKNDMEKID